MNSDRFLTENRIDIEADGFVDPRLPLEKDATIMALAREVFSDMGLAHPPQVYMHSGPNFLNQSMTDENVIVLSERLQERFDPLSIKVLIAHECAHLGQNKQIQRMQQLVNQANDYYETDEKTHIHRLYEKRGIKRDPLDADSMQGKLDRFSEWIELKADEVAAKLYGKQAVLDMLMKLSVGSKECVQYVCGKGETVKAIGKLPPEQFIERLEAAVRLKPASPDDHEMIKRMRNQMMPVREVG